MSAPDLEPAAAVTIVAELGGHRLGLIAIDSFVAGRSCGGLRILPDATAAEMHSLARAMTLKYGLLGLPQGGAKAVVFGDPEASRAERRARLAEFARAAAPMLRARTFIPAPDIATDASDIRFMLTAAGVRVAHRELRSNRSGDYTAASVFGAACAALDRAGRSLPGATVAIEGFGKVGSALAMRLAAAGARVVGVSTSRGAVIDRGGFDPAALCRLAEVEGSGFVERVDPSTRASAADLLELDVDLLCPCARGATITPANAERVRARVICAGANDPISLDAERSLLARGVEVVPDFLCNLGGVLGGTMEFAGIRPPVIESFVERVARAQVVTLRASAERRRESLRETATRVALERHAQQRTAAEHPGIAQRCLTAAIGLFRHGLVPEALVSRLALVWFERTRSTGLDSVRDPPNL